MSTKRASWDWDEDVPTKPTRHYTGAAAVAGVFKLAAWLVLLVGVIATAITGVLSSGSTGHAIAVAAITLGCAVFGAASLAFFGYVLDLLRAIARSVSSEGGERP